MALGDVYEKTGASTWTKRATVVGATGPAGAQGATGQAEAWHSGSGVPSSGLGADGDWYLDTAGSQPGYTPPAYVTSLPASPTDGQEVYYAADAANGVIWHLRYRAAATGSYKWEYVGGAPLNAHEVTTVAHPGAYSGTSPTLPAPLAGVYDISIGGAVNISATGGYVGIGAKVGASAPSAAQTSACPYTAGYGIEAPMVTGRQTIAVAGTVVTAQGASLIGANHQTTARRLRLQPVAVA